MARSVILPPGMYPEEVQQAALDAWAEYIRWWPSKAAWEQVSRDIGRDIYEGMLKHDD